MIKEMNRLVENAYHDSVTVERLTTQQFGLVMGKLYSKPLAEYLDHDEQPHFVLDCNPDEAEFAGLGAPTAPKGTINGTGKGIFTDRRLILVSGNKNGDQVLSIPREEIVELTMESGFVTTELAVETRRGTLTMECHHPTEDEDVHALGEFFTGFGSREENEFPHSSVLYSHDRGREPFEAYEHIDEYGPDITERIEQIESTLEPTEEVQYLFRGSYVRVYGDGLDDRVWCQNYYAGVTDRRIVGAVQQTNGYEITVVPFSTVQSCDVKTTPGCVSLNVRTDDETHVLRLHNTNEAEVTNAVSFVRSHRGPNNTETASSSDPTEQLKNLSELYEADILTDDEFESKKQELLDKI